MQKIMVWKRFSFFILQPTVSLFKLTPSCPTLMRIMLHPVSLLQSLINNYWCGLIVIDIGYPVIWRLDLTKCHKCYNKYGGGLNWAVVSFSWISIQTWPLLLIPMQQQFSLLVIACLLGSLAHVGLITHSMQFEMHCIMNLF